MKYNRHQILPRSFYQRDTVIVAKELIGNILVRYIDGVTVAGIITETEAYRDDDPACHAYRGKTPRTAPLFGTVGMAYVYFIYGVHFCFNIVARAPEQQAGGVLIRAIKPLIGIEYMRQWRRTACDKNLANGPGKLTQALNITGNHNYVDCTRMNELFVVQNSLALPIRQTTRIGISQARDTLWRFWVWFP